MAKTFLFSLDEDLFGDKMKVVTDRLHSIGISATVFVDHKTTMSRRYIAQLKEQGFDLQMHWVRLKRKSRFLFPVEVSFKRQKQDLESLLDKEILGNRTHGLEWRCPFPRISSFDFVFPWHVMEIHGIRFSSSTYGFPHPFTPKTILGADFALTEVPVTHYERVPENEDFVVGLYHPHYDCWAKAAVLGKEYGYVFKTVSQFLEESK